MPGWLWILFWWLAFSATHLALSSTPVRTPIISRVGDRGFQGIYSLVAFATFIPLVTVYWRNKHSGPLLWSLAGLPGIWHASILLSVVACVLLVLSFVQPSPVGIAPGESRPRGVTRITRHPLFAALGIWGLAHMLVNGFLSDVMFFGGFLVFFFAGTAHQDARKRQSPVANLGAFYAETSALPFAAILSGRTRFVLAEIPLLPALGGVLVAIVLYVLHPILFMG